MKRRLIPALLITTFLAIIAICLIWTLIVPKYKATAEIRIKPNIPYLVFQTEDNGIIPFYDSFVNTQVSILKSPAILQRVLDMREIQETNWYKNPEESLSSYFSEKKITRLERLKDNLIVTPRSQTEIIDASFLAPNPADAKLIVDSVLETYMKYIHDKTDATDNEIYGQLVEQYNRLDMEIRGREEFLAHLSKEIGMKEPQELITSKMICLEESEAKLNNIKYEIKIIEWQLHDPNNIPLLEPETNKEKLELQLAQKKFEIQLLSNDIKNQKNVLDKILAAVQTIESENKLLQNKRELFEAVRKRLDQKNMERNVPEPIEILAGVFVPSKPYNDNRILLTVITSIIWLGLFSLIITISRIRSRKDETIK